MSVARQATLALITGLSAAAMLTWNGHAPRSPADLIGKAEARIGRPLTPMSYAGVARRTTRRAGAVGAAGAAAAGTYYYAPPPCVQVVNAYGQVVCQ